MLRIIENSFRGEHKLGQFPEDMLITVQEGTCCILGSPQMFLHVNIKMLNHLLTHFIHAGINLFLHIILQFLKCGINLFLGTTLLVNLQDAAFKVYTVCLAKHFITGSEDIIKEFKLFTKQIKNANIRIVASIDEVYHHHIIFLSITMTSTYALFDSLRIPRQVIVDD